MPIFIKENQVLNKKSFKLPKNLQQHLKDTLAKYGDYKEEEGYKRLNSLINPDYNKRNDKKSGDEREISFADLIILLIVRWQTTRVRFIIFLSI